MQNLTIEKRIARLERQNRVLIIALGATSILLSMCAALGMRQTRPQSIDASEFRVLDEQGKPRASFAMTETGPALILMDDAANSRVKLMLDTVEGPALFMSDHNRVDRIALRVEPTGAALAVSDDHGAERIRFATSEIGASIGLFDAQLKNRARLAIDQSGLPAFQFFTENALPVFSLVAKEDGPSVAINNLDGRHVWCIPEDSQPEPADTVADGGAATSDE